jgi:catalase
MRKVIVILILFGVLVSTNLAWASVVDDLTMKILPSSKLYFLKIWYEKLSLLFTFNTEKRAEKYRKFAEERAYEITKMLNIGRGDLAKKPREIYMSYLNKAKEELQKAIRKTIEKKKEDIKQRLEQKLNDLIDEIIQSIKL